MSGFIGQIWKRRQVRGAMRELLSAIWLMDPPEVQALIGEVATGARVFQSMGDVRDAIAFAAEREAELQSKPYMLADGVAHIPIVGPIMKEVPCIFRALEIAATSTVATIAALERAEADDDVKSILLDFDTPGGTLSGTAQLAKTVARIAKTKTVNGHADDLVASAGYWVAAQTDRFSAFETADVGSIGVYTVIEDSSKFFEEGGIKVYRITSGRHKGIGVEGAEVTEEHLKLYQEQIDKAAEMFIAAVATGRGINPEAVAKLATGRTWYATEALELNLLDAVETDREAHKHITDRGSSQPDSPPDNETAPDDDGAAGGNDMPKPKEGDSAAAGSGPVALERELASTKVDLEKATSRAKTAETKLKEIRQARLTKILDAHQARGAFDPQDREKYDRNSQSYLENPEDLNEFLATFPTRDARQPGSDGPKPPEHTNVSSEFIKLGMSVGLTKEDLELADNVQELSLVSGEAVLRDGSTTQLEEVSDG